MKLFEILSSDLIFIISYHERLLSRKEDQISCRKFIKQLYVTRFVEIQTIR